MLWWRLRHPLGRNPISLNPGVPICLIPATSSLLTGMASCPRITYVCTSSTGCKMRPVFVQISFVSDFRGLLSSARSCTGEGSLASMMSAYTQTPSSVPLPRSKRWRRSMRLGNSRFRTRRASSSSLILEASP